MRIGLLLWVCGTGMVEPGSLLFWMKGATGLTSGASFVHPLRSSLTATTAAQAYGSATVGVLTCGYHDSGILAFSAKVSMAGFCFSSVSKLAIPALSAVLVGAEGARGGFRWGGCIVRCYSDSWEVGCY